MQTHRPTGHFVQLQTTLDSRDEARSLCRRVVERRLAACGQIVGPIQSIYRWQGAVEDTQEWLCLFKTTRARARALAAFIGAEHPYEVPEIVATALDEVSDAYGEWIDEETTD
jgi:periplasmic divalent cation tolerance protein